MRHLIASALGAAGVLLAAPFAQAQLRIAEWNISNYNGGRTSAIHASVYGQFEGRSMAPDAFVLQEFLSQTAVDQFVAALNTAPGSPGDWAAAPFDNGPDTDNAFVYRTSRVQFLGMTIVAVGGNSPNHPRNINRYDIRPVGYDAAEATIACYSVHMKSGTGSDDQQRRLLEAQRVRDDAEQLPTGWSFLIGGDFNIQSSSQAAYQEMVGAQVSDAGRFFDPISTPGSWNNNSAFRFVHTQDPAGAGGMDDRHDQILLSDSLIEQTGLAYVGQISLMTGQPVPYSTVTWDDANHSYRSWGNDGTTFDQSLRVEGNAMVGPTIAQALKDMCVGAGHLPVFLDLRVPAEVSADEAIDFGTVAMGETATQTLTVLNAGDTGLWGDSGISALHYAMDATGVFGAPAGSFLDDAGGGGIQHEVTMDTSAPGEFMGTLTIYSDAPDEPVRVVMLSGVVTGGEPCVGDIDGDGLVNFTDLNMLLGNFNAVGAGLAGDLDGDGDVDFADLNTLLGVYNTACEG